ncbi:protoporphyrinogen oxidase [Alloacidobacterium dinghuense]|uniref:Coproporphyrinogen III oxidase n=1 Tax=Alloacidobacterium dinghuense TaxID=2763107 RepID=A0A7G8BK24_9BACT|nr:protoporphyrinogen oxidase [Alloacidobacterium dinghuense]QNI32894.1 protoporphyrinogen oxidase [Alloacidobacterium dinghuense]
MRVAVIGGGIAGVSAAHELAQSGIEFVLYEASGRLGGIVETVCRDGFVIECGPDSWVTEKPWARELAVELGLEDEIVASNDHWRKTYIVRGGELVAMPDGMRMMVPTQWEPVLSSPLFSKEAQQAYLREPERAEELKTAVPESDESVASFVRRHFGDEVTDTIGAPLLAGVFGGDVDELSVRAVMPAFVKMEREHGSLIAALEKSSRGAQSASIFTTLKSGLQTLIDRMVATLPASSIRLRKSVQKIEFKGGKWCIFGPFAEEFDAVVVATPADVTRGLLSPMDPAFDQLLAMDASSAIVVALAFAPEIAKSLRIPPGFGFLAPQSRSAAERSSVPSLLACTFVDQKFSHRVPEGGVLLRAFFGGASAPLLLDSPDDEVTGLALRQLSSLLGQLPEPSFTVVRRWPRSLPQYAVGHLERMARLEERVRALPGLELIGNAYYGVGLPDLVRQGREAARRVISPLPPG